MNSTKYSDRNINVVSGMTLKPNGEYMSLTDIPLPSQEDNSETYWNSMSVFPDYLTILIVLPVYLKLNITEDYLLG